MSLLDSTRADRPQRRSSGATVASTIELRLRIELSRCRAALRRILPMVRAPRDAAEVMALKEAAELSEGRRSEPEGVS
jgi:hypothetical protein